MEANNHTPMEVNKNEHLARSGAARTTSDVEPDVPQSWMLYNELCKKEKHRRLVL